MQWQDVKITMKDITRTKDGTFFVHKESFVSEETNQISKILDTKDQPANIQKMTDEHVHFNKIKN